MRITNLKDMMVMILVGMRRDVILAYDNVKDDPSAEEAYYVLASYTEHVREARKYGIKLGDVLAMHGYFDELMSGNLTPVDKELLKILYGVETELAGWN